MGLVQQDANHVGTEDGKVQSPVRIEVSNHDVLKIHDHVDIRGSHKGAIAATDQNAQCSVDRACGYYVEFPVLIEVADVHGVKAGRCGVAVISRGDEDAVASSDKYGCSGTAGLGQIHL